jgi:DNA repair exonuclease SbcCD ATPase subunit
LIFGNGENLSQEITRLILPFSVLSENRKEPFTKEMEKAAIFCFAELERAKGRGLILKQPTEKLGFIVESYYPFWLIPWGKSNILFDGLNVTAHTLTYKAIPDVKAFMENVERSSKAQETYMVFLSGNVNYFQTPSDEKVMTIDALIAEQNFLKEFNPCISEAEHAEVLSSDIVFLQPTIDESTISSITQELENLKLNFKEDVDILYESIKFINKTTRSFVKTIRGKIKAIKEEYDEEVKKQESVIMPKVNRINEEYDEQIAKLMKNFEKQLHPLQREKVKLEKIKEQTLGKIERCNVEAKTCAASKDVVGERRWKEKAGESKKEFSEIEAKIEEVEEKMKGIEESRSLETFRLRSEWEAKVKEAKKDLLELEASRDAKIQIHKQEMDKLESLTSAIIQQMDKIAKLREADLANFEKLGVQQKHKSPTLIYMPFYLACYEAEVKKRYVVFSPSFVNSIGFTTKIKGALGKAKVKHLLVPRFKSITSLLNKLPALIEQNVAFGREVYEAGDKADMLKSSSMREQIKSGLEKLKGEGWLSQREYEAFAELCSKIQA